MKPKGSRKIKPAIADSYTMQIEELSVLVVRKSIKNLYLSIRPPDGRVRINVPLHVPDEFVRKLLLQRLPWIRDKQSRRSGDAVPAPLTFSNGENHYYQGRQYVLELVHEAGRPSILPTSDGRLLMRVDPSSETADREKVLRAWYRQRLKEEATPFFDKWEMITGLKVAEWRIKDMKTRWGTCNPTARRIWMSLELAKVPPRCMEYVVLHEIAHFVERTHNKRFQDYLSRYMPDWRQRKAELNRRSADTWSE